MNGCLHAARKPECETGLKVLLGAEAEMAAGVVAFTPHSASLVDYIICPHSHTHMKGFVLPTDADTPEKHADFLVKSFYSLCMHPLAKYILGIAHPMYPIGKTVDEADRLFAHMTDDALFFICRAAAKADLALELNGSVSLSCPLTGLHPRVTRAFSARPKVQAATFSLAATVTAASCTYRTTRFPRAGEIAEALGLCEADFTRALDKAMSL